MVMKSHIRHTAVHRPESTSYRPGPLVLLLCCLLLTQCGQADRETGVFETAQKYLYAPYERLLAYDAAACAFRWRDNTLTVDAYPGLLLRVRTNNYRLQGMTGARMVYAYDSMPYLILETASNKVVLSFAAR